LSDTYPCSIWPGYGGPWFNHTNARAVQLNIRDPQGRLIRPDETYLWLAPGAIVLIHATMHIFKYKQTSYFQLNATSIQIIDKSDINVAPPSVLSLPSPDKTRFGSASAADSAPILNFSSMMNTETASTTVPAASSSRAPHTRKHDIDIDNDMFDTPIDVNNLSINDDVEMDDSKGKKNASKKAKKGSNIDLVQNSGMNEREESTDCEDIG
ncbi:hypothetical protein F5880DRAFT_1506869, partial [Lentinula raphanica]